MAPMACVLGLVVFTIASAYGDPVGPGFPDCFRNHSESNQTIVEEIAEDLVCVQKLAPPSAIKIACVGDSITAGYDSSGRAHTYPSQLQSLLDASHGKGAYSVTNLGESGSTMLKKGDWPYWKTHGYRALTSKKWDIVVIMLGTNDAKDRSLHGPNNWQHDCGSPNHITLEGCSFATDYKAMIDVIKTLGTSAAGPQIYVMTPVPLMAEVYGMSQIVINGVFPKLVPLIQKDNGVLGPMISMVIWEVIQIGRQSFLKVVYCTLHFLLASGGVTSKVAVNAILAMPDMPRLPG